MLVAFDWQNLATQIYCGQKTNAQEKMCFITNVCIPFTIMKINIDFKSDTKHFTALANNADVATKILQTFVNSRRNNCIDLKCATNSYYKTC